MTVSSIVPVNNYTGNSSVVNFDFDFLIEKENELVVQHTDANGITSVLQYNVDYSIKEIGNKNGSYITFPLNGSSYKVLGSDEHISLALSLQIEQESEFHNSSYFNLNILEWTFDYIVRILQILSRKIDRCVKVEESETVFPDDIMEELNNKCEKVHTAHSDIVDLSKEMESYKDLAIDSYNNAQKEANIAKEQAKLATDKAGIATAKTEEVVQKANEAISNIENKKTASVNAINSTSSTQIFNIEKEGATQVNLAKEQVNIATEQANIAMEQAKQATINAKEAGLIIGQSIALYCTKDYVPDGCLPCDGGEYAKTQFSNLWNNYLVSSTVRLNTCTYSEYQQEVATYGQCAKFAVDTTNGKFKVPLMKDGTVIQQALADGELAKCYNAGLPNITGFYSGFRVGNEGDPKATGALQMINDAVGTLGSGSGTSNRIQDIGFDASLSNLIYGNSDTVQMNAIALRHFVVVSNGQLNQSTMDWSEWATSLQGKLNADLSNLTDLSNFPKPYVIETYVNGKSGYRVWSDGYCEQWGTATATTGRTSDYSYVTLLKPYKSDDYIVIASKEGNETVSVAVNCPIDPTAEKFGWSIGYTSPLERTIEWRAIGYIK